jgi:hypothetical protein
MAMAARRRKPGSTGRVTPKGGAPAARPAGRRVPADEPIQVGRRPSNPAFLLLVGVMWIAVGIIVMVAASFGWRFIPGVAFIGVGLFFLRGAGATVVRREQRRPNR